MRWIRTMVVLVLAAVMPPLAIQCPAESSGSCFAMVDGDTDFDHPDHSSPPGGCACVQSEKGMVARSILPRKGMLWGPRKSATVATRQPSSVSLTLPAITRAPQELLAGWQFIRREALSPRAPSSPS
jgi:hypothetical protein